MDRRKLLKGIASAALLPFIPKIVKDVAPAPLQNFAMFLPNNTYEHDVHGEQFYAGKSDFHWERGLEKREYIIYTSQDVIDKFNLEVRKLALRNEIL